MIREEDAHLLETVESPYHPRIERSTGECFTRKKENGEMCRIKLLNITRTSGFGQRNTNYVSSKNEKKLLELTTSNEQYIT